MGLKHWKLLAGPCVGVCMGCGSSSGAMTNVCTETPNVVVSALDLAPDAGSPGISAAVDLAVGGANVYYSIDSGGARVQGQPVPQGMILRVPASGGRPVILAPIVDVEVALVATPTSVVYAEFDPWNNVGKITSVPAEGGTATVLASTSTKPNGALAVDADSVYFGDTEGTKSVPLGGGPTRVITTHAGAFALIDSDLVIADSTEGTILKVPAGGGEILTLAQNQQGVTVILRCGSGICWFTSVSSGSVAAGGSGSIVQLESGGTPVVLAQGPGLFSVWRAAFDGKEFFATVLGDASSGELLKIAPADGSIVFMGGAASVAVDGNCLFAAYEPKGIYSTLTSYNGILP